MIPILYEANETKFNHNGLGLLSDVIYFEVEEERNESYEAEMAYPINSRLYSELKGNRIIKAKANDRFETQLFRIYYISKPLYGKIIVKLEHISYKLKDNFIEAVNYTGDCQGALNAMNNNAAFPTGFTFKSDIAMSTNFIVDKKNFWKCIKGESGSIVDTYGNGADIVRDNFNISVMKEGGLNNNVLISYQKNLSGLKCEEDWTGCITKIYPYAVRDDITYILNEKYVDSQYVNRDPNPRIEAVDFSSEFENDEEITQDKLRNFAKNYFINNKCDIPQLTYSVELIALSKTEECKNIANENIGMFDYLIIKHELYNINTTVKVVKTKYDSIKERYLKLEVNFKKDNLSKTINDTKKKIKETDKKIDDTKEELKEDVKEAKEEAANATNNLKVVMEKRDSEIELSVANEAEQRKAEIKVMDGKIEQRVTSKEFSTYKSQTDREISQKVSQGDEFTSELKQNVDAFQFLFEEASGSKTEITRNGLTIYKGGIEIKDNNGNTVMDIDSNGVMRITAAGIKDLNIYDTSSGSMFYNTLANMDEISCGEIKPSRLTISSSDFYINDGYDLKEYIEKVVKNM